MNDFTILHLSDLHFNVKNNVLPTLMNNLLDDIADQVKFIDNNIIIVVTGDLIHKGNYEYEASVLKFFRALSKIIGDKFQDIYIVPGNHDKERNAIDKMILEKYVFTENDSIARKFKAKYWQYISYAFNKHLKLVEKIYKIFYKKNLTKHMIIKETYGVNVTEIGNIRIAFIRLNTAWACVGDKDERKLKIGLFQLMDIYEQYESKKIPSNKELKNEYTITITLAHHPLNWLDGREETRVQSYLLSNALLNTDIYISGHIHDRDVINFHNTTHSLNTLVSGIGWPDSENNLSSSAYEHTYSWYTFNLDVNSIDVYVRKSDKAGTFETDTSIYTRPLFKEEEKIAMPINENKTQAFIEISTIKGRTTKVAYMTTESLIWMKSYMNIAIKIKAKLKMELEKIRKQAYEELAGDINSENLMDFLLGGDSTARDELRMSMKESDDVINKEFDAFLGVICRDILKIIEDELYLLDRKNHDLRVHFRKLYFEENKSVYKKLSVDCSNGRNGIGMRPINGELIMAAFETATPLIASVNKSICRESINDNKKKTDKNQIWSDFITMIPQFTGNEVKYRDDKNNWKSIPWITFGVTIYSCIDKSLLYLMDYYRFDKLVTESIDEFLWFFPVVRESFDKYVKTTGEKYEW